MTNLACKGVRKNKANLPKGSGYRGQGSATYHLTPSCETKPVGTGIRFQGSGISGPTPDTRHGKPVLSRKTKPICLFRAKTRFLAVRSRKRSGGDAQPTKSAGNTAATGTNSCETKPIPRGAGVVTSTLWRKGYDELGLQGRAKKQSQFVEGIGVQGSRVGNRVAATPGATFARKISWPGGRIALDYGPVLPRRASVPLA